MKKEEKHWQIGDWGYHEFELVEITGMTNKGEITQVSGGVTSRGGSHIKVYPLSQSNKNISEYFENEYNKLHEKHRNMNFPYIHRKFVVMWEQAIALSDDKEVVQSIYDDLKDFCKRLCEVAEMEVDGIKVMRP